MGRIWGVDVRASKDQQVPYGGLEGDLVVGHADGTVSDAPAKGPAGHGQPGLGFPPDDGLTGFGAAEPAPWEAMPQSFGPPDDGLTGFGAAEPAPWEAMPQSFGPPDDQGADEPAPWEAMPQSFRPPGA